MGVVLAQGDKDLNKTAEMSLGREPTRGGSKLAAVQLPAAFLPPRCRLLAWQRRAWARGARRSVAGGGGVGAGHGALTRAHAPGHHLAGAADGVCLIEVREVGQAAGQRLAAGGGLLGGKRLQGGGEQVRWPGWETLRARGAGSNADAGVTSADAARCPLPSCIRREAT